MIGWYLISRLRSKIRHKMNKIFISAASECIEKKIFNYLTEYEWLQRYNSLSLYESSILCITESPTSDDQTSTIDIANQQCE